MLALAGCGQAGGGEGEPLPLDYPERASAAAERLCSTYRQAVAKFRYSGSRKQQAADLRAAARAAEKALDETGEEDLLQEGPAYLEALDAIIPAYERAATAATTTKRRSPAYFIELAVLKSRDERLDTNAERAGLERCSLDEPRSGEQRVSQAGFPTVIVPTGGGDVAPTKDQSSLLYPVSGKESIVLERGERIPTGTVSTARAARMFGRSHGRFRTLEATRALGDEQLPMRGYRYVRDRERGTLTVFSGQGHVWLIVCSSSRPQGPSRTLRRACRRAVATAGFMML